MRKKKNTSRAFPFIKGLAAGYIATIAVAAAGALIMWIFGADSGLSWLPATLAAAAGSFFCGRAAGKLRRRSGLKTGAFCGAIYFAPLIILGLIFGTAGALIPVKAVLCTAFGAAGGVYGVNSPES